MIKRANALQPIRSETNSSFIGGVAPVADLFVRRQRSRHQVVDRSNEMSAIADTMSSCNGCAVSHSPSCLSA
jgi:hypothetical protein